MPRSCRRNSAFTSNRFRNVGASDQKDESGGPHDRPKNASDTPDHLVFQRPKRRSETRLLEQLPAERGIRAGPASQPNGNHAGNIGIRLRQGDTGLEPGDPQKTQVSQMKPVPLEPQRDEEIGILAPQAKEGFRHHADNLARA
jgi:hypothetical protein